jgi:hypothetical protein
MVLDTLYRRYIVHMCGKAQRKEPRHEEKVYDAR